ncbi:MAG: sensor histidine kinase [Chitinophagaceae bacterium]
MKNKTGQILLHITGCIAFLSLPVLLSPDVSWNFKFIRMAPFQEDFISYTLLLLFFYFHYFYLIPRLYFKEKFISYSLLILGSYILIAFLPDLLVPGNHPMPMHQPPLMHFDNGGMPPPNGSGMPPMGPPHPNFFWMIPRFEHLFQFFIVLVLSALIRINNRLKQTEKEKVNAELSYLKAQINPHFLFNTLNSIYSSALEENADNTASAVVKLSGMMRYVISEAHNEYVSLEKEIAYITDYIELQRIRLGNTVHIAYNVKGDRLGKKIAPLLLISFIENAFKHGVNPEEKSGIAIGIEIKEMTLQMNVSNSKVKTVNADAIKNNIGLENTSNRLQLLYPSKHELLIKQDDKEFIVSLKIDLQ